MLQARRGGSKRFLEYLSTSFKDAQKDVGWETWTPLAVPGRYALIEGDMRFFDTGMITNVVRRHFYAGRGFGPAGIAAFVELEFLNGRSKLEGVPIHCLVAV